MPNGSKLIERCFECQMLIYFFIESLEADELNASDVAQLMSIKNYATKIVE